MGDPEGSALRLTTVAGGALSVLSGVLLRNLFTSLRLMAAIIGLMWIVGGIAEIAWRRRSGVLLGVLSIAAGLAVLPAPDLSLTVMAAVAGAWLILFGLLLLVRGGRVRPAPPPTVVPD